MRVRGDCHGPFWVDAVTRSAYHRPIADLVWLYHDAAGELGVSAMPIEPVVVTGSFDARAADILPGWVSAPVPTERQVMMARRSRQIRDILRQLPSSYVGILEACHAHELAPNVSADAATQRALGIAAHRERARMWAEYHALAKVYGIAAGAILQVLRVAGHDPTKLKPSGEGVAAGVAMAVGLAMGGYFRVARGYGRGIGVRADEDVVAIEAAEAEQAEETWRDEMRELLRLRGARS